MQEETREYQKVISYLSQMIAGGELAIGSRLPTERSLAETLSIGRNSTREALRMLEHTGVIVCKRIPPNHGNGTYDAVAGTDRPKRNLLVSAEYGKGSLSGNFGSGYLFPLEGAGGRLAAEGTGTTATG